MLNAILNKYTSGHSNMGSKSARAGHAYEEFVKSIFSNQGIVDNFNKCIAPHGIEEQIFYQTCARYNIDVIKSIEIVEVPLRDTGGPPKTDVCVKINDHVIKISVKQSSASSIAVAEFDVDTIRKEIGITDKVLLDLMRKFQTDASGKNFDDDERENLRNRVAPVKEQLVRWTLSGSPDEYNEDLRIANHTIMFKVDHSTRDMKDFSTYTIEEQIKKITTRTSGYGTGLSWTHASGTRGKKIQFKCPVL